METLCSTEKINTFQVSLDMEVGTGVLEPNLNKLIEGIVGKMTNTRSYSSLRLSVVDEKFIMAGDIVVGTDPLLAFGDQRVSLNATYKNDDGGAGIVLDDFKCDVNLSTRAKLAVWLAEIFGNEINFANELKAEFDQPNEILSSGIGEFAGGYGLKIISFNLGIVDDGLKVSALAEKSQ